MAEEIFGGVGGGGGSVLAAGANITLSTSGGSVTVIGGAGGAGFTAGVSSGGNTLGTTGVVANQLLLVGGTNVTLSQSSAAGGATVTIIGPTAGSSQTLQTSGLFQATLAGNTAGALADISSGTLTLAGGNNITLSQLGNAVTISGANSGIDVSLSGNTLGALVLVSSGTLMLIGGNNITLSQSSHSVTIIGESGGGAAFSAGVSTGGNTLGTTGTVSNQVLFVGGSNVTLSQSSGVGGATVTIIGEVQGGAQTGISGIAGSGASTVTAGTVQFQNSNGITFGLNGSTMTASHNAITSQSIQTENRFNLTLSGNTTGTLAGVSSGTLTLAGGNNITLSQVGNAITISGPSGGGAGVSTGGNTAGTTGTVDYQLVFVGGSNISLSQSVNGSSGTITINGVSGGGAAFSAGVSTGGNTAGTTGTVSNQVLFVGSNNITLSQSSAAGGATITISGPTQTSGAQSIGASNLGNTLGTSGMASGNLVQFAIVGSNNITLSQSINGASGTVTINGADIPQIAETVNPVASAGSVGVQALYAPQDHRHAGVFSIGISTDGNTAGTSGVLPGQMVFVGGNNITLSQSSSAGNLMTLTISAGNAGAGGSLSQWMPGGVGASSFTQLGQSTLILFPAQLQEFASISRADLFGSVSVSTSSNSSHGGTLSLNLGIYTRNVSTMSLASSGSVSYAWTVTGSTSSVSVVGMRAFSLPINASMTPGEYFIGLISRTATANTNWVTLSNLGLVAFPNAYSGQFFAATNASNQFVAGLGVFSAQTAALPASVAFGDLLATSASTARPVINFLNYTA